MNKNYSVETIDGILIVRFLDQPTFSDIQKAMEEISVNKTRLRLWDLSKGLDLSTGEIRGVADFGKRAFKSPSKIALVAPSDLSFGLSNMHKVYRGQDILEEKIFRTEEEAINWLKT